MDERRDSEQEYRDVVVVGGGLAGLAAGATAARDGARTLVLEARDDPGGRARTAHHGGYSFNQGPHALYRAGAGTKVLRSLGVEPDGAVPNLVGTEVADGGRLRRVANPFVLGGSGVAATSAVFAPGALEPAEELTMAEWVARLGSPRAADVARSMVRVTSYVTDLEHADAASLIRQARRGARGVWYLHDGWGSLVAGLRAAAIEAGAEVRTGVKVGAVVPRSEPGGAVEVVLRGAGPALRAGAVVLATGGADGADRLLEGRSARVARWAADARPVVAGCLDVALRRLPLRSHATVIGLDEPTYLIAHSLAARLAPEGGALVHVMRYGDDIADPDELRASLESQLDRAQPGWRDALVEARFGRRLVVAHDLPRPGTDRPDIEPGDVGGVWAAGDWITTNGLIGDAALDSGHRAGLAAARSADRSQPASHVALVGFDPPR